jgi:hypothetical protein
MLLSIISENDEIKATELSIRSLLSVSTDIYQTKQLPDKMSRLNIRNNFPARDSVMRLIFGLVAVTTISSQCNAL